MAGPEHSCGVVGVAADCDGEERFIDCDGWFSAIGLIPSNGMVEGMIQLDKYGYVVSGENCLTDEPGVYVAGDCRTKSVRQITTATADGATAALAACRYLDGR